jgi:hypothetical protein
MFVSEFEHRSTLSSDVSHDGEAFLTEKDHKYEKLAKMLKEPVLGANSVQRIFVESQFTGILESTSMFEIPCFLSSDQQFFYVFLGSMEVK